VAKLVEAGLAKWKKVLFNGALKEIRSEAILNIEREAIPNIERSEKRNVAAETITEHHITRAYADDKSYDQERIELYDELTQGMFAELGARARQRLPGRRRG